MGLLSEIAGEWYVLQEGESDLPAPKIEWLLYLTLIDELNRQTGYGRF